MIRLSRRVLCVDWDRRALRLVVARVGAGVVSLEDAHSYRMPADVETENAHSMGVFLGQMLKRHHWKKNRVVVDVSRDKAVINRLSLPPTPADELAAAVQFQAMRELPFPLEQAAIDFVVTQRSDDNMVTEVMLAAIRTEVLARVQETCHVAGVRPARIGLRPYANLVCVRHLPDLGDQRVLFIDIGPNMTEIDVMHRGVLFFSRSANVDVPESAGGTLVGEGSVVFSKVELAEAEAPDQKAMAAVHDLEVEVTRTLQAYRATESGAAIDHVVIAGGTGIESHLLDALDRRLGLPSQLFDPSSPLGLAPEEGEKLRSFSATLGLTWGLSREGLLELDFLNPKRPVPRSAIIKRRLRTIGTIAGTAAAVAIISAAYYGWKLSSTSSALRKQLTQLKSDERQRAYIETNIDRIDEMPDPIWLVHLHNIIESMVAPEREGAPEGNVGDKLLVQRIDFRGDRGTVISLTVLASDITEITRFEKMLNAYRDNGHEIYHVQVGNWVPTSEYPGYTGSMKLDVELTGLRKQMLSIEKAEKGRKSLTRSFTRKERG